MKDSERKDLDTPVNPALLLEQAVGAVRAGEYYRALAILDNLIRSGYVVRELHHLRALALKSSFKFHRALAAVEEELKLFPDNKIARQTRQSIVNILSGQAPPSDHDIEAACGLHLEQRLFQTDLAWDVLNRMEQGRKRFSYKGLSFPRDPFSIAIQMRMLEELKPLSIVEIGVCGDGATLWLADMVGNLKLDSMIITIGPRPLDDPRIRPITAASSPISLDFLSQELANFPHPMLLLVAPDQPIGTYQAALNFFDACAAPTDLIMIEGAIASQVQSRFAIKSPPHQALEEFIENHPGEYQAAAEYSDYFGTNMTWAQNGILRKSPFAVNPALRKPFVRAFKTQDPGTQSMPYWLNENERAQIYAASFEASFERHPPYVYVAIGERAVDSVLVAYNALITKTTAIAALMVSPGSERISAWLQQLLGPTLKVLPGPSSARSNELRAVINQVGNLPLIMTLDLDPDDPSYEDDILAYAELLAPGGILAVPYRSARNQGGTGSFSRAEHALSSGRSLTPIGIPLLYPTDTVTIESVSMPSRLAFYKKMRT